MIIEDEESVSIDNGKLRWEDYHILNPGRPPRRVFDIEEALEFLNEIGEELLRARRYFRILITVLLCILILIVIVFIIFFVLVYNGTIVF